MSRRQRGPALAPGILALLAALVAVLAAAPATLAAEGAMRLEPATITVTRGGTFEVIVVHETPASTSGAQATLLFDPSRLQVDTVERAAPYVGADFTLPQDLTGAIAAANGTGTLRAVASAFLPPAEVPPGAQAFLVVVFRAVACGPAVIDLPAGAADAMLLDARQGRYGEPLEVAPTGATVTVQCAESGASAAPTPASGGQPVALAGGSTTDGQPLGMAGLLAALAAGLAVVALLAALLVRRTRGAA